MKQLKCEICGGTELIKQDGVFVCQNCGCKYSAEEVKKIMLEVEGTVNVSIDNSSKIDSWKQMADSAYESRSYEEAYAYYCKIIENDLYNWFATFRKGMSKAWQSKLNNIQYNEVVGALTNATKVMTQLDYMEDVDIANAKGFMVTEIYNWLTSVGQLVTNHAEEFCPKLESACNEFFSRELDIIRMVDFLVDAIDENTLKHCPQNIQLLNMFSKMAGVILTNVNQSFEVKTGSHWDSFWGHSVDDYSTFSASNIIKQSALSLQEKINLRIKQENSRAKTEKYENVLRDNVGKSTSELLILGYRYLQNFEHIEASAIFDEIVKRVPDERIGYLGKAVALATNDEGCSFDTLFSPIIISKNKNVSQEYELDTQKILDFPCGESGLTLLMHACGAKRVDVVRILLDMGADIHKRSTMHNVTALWMVCNKALPPNKKEEGRNIAKLLLDLGADVDITNKGGVALYNETTDLEIARMITDKYPSLQKGSAAGSNAASNSGCYVATCVYGSYDCPQVWTLRRYRDDTLASSWYGRAFIRTYYAVSPTIVKWFGNTQWFKKMWKNKLDNMVSKLRNNGVEDTPYQDKDWR